MFQSIRRTKAEQLNGLTGFVSARKVAHNTIERTLTDGTRVVRLHLTDIVTFSPDGSVTLNSGGFKSLTTKERMNRYLPSGWSLWAERGCWYLCNRAEDKRFVFADGITINSDGSVTGSDPDDEHKTREINRKIAKYVKAMAALPTLPRPDLGDCLYCCMRVSGTVQPLGEACQDTGHLLSHLDEQYIMGSLILNAMQAAGCTPFVIGMAFADGATANSIGREHATRAVRRYFRAGLGLSR